MAKVCDLCGKSPKSGNSRCFSNKATKRVFKPNLQPIRLNDSPSTKATLKICNTCRRTLTKTR